MIQELWVQIKYNSSYAVSNLGRIRNVQNFRIINGCNNGDGYVSITFGYANNSYIRMMAHRIVAEHFIPNPLNKPFVNHIDANRSNNSVDNLEWCTQAENIQHAHKIGTAGGIHSGHAKFTKTQILCIKYMYAHGYTINSLIKIFDCERIVLRKLITGITYKLEPFKITLRKEKRICRKRGSYKNKIKVI